MAYSDFNENNYTNRSSGLAAWLNGVGNATPSVIAQNAPISSDVAAALQNQAARSAGFDTSEVNANSTQSSPLQDFANADPTTKAVMLGQEAFNPGSSQPVAAPEPAFRDTAIGAILGGILPNTVGKVFDQQRGKALTAFMQNQPSDPIAAIQGMANVDPTNGAAYAGEMTKYMAANNSPIAKTQAEEAAMTLNMEKFKNNAIMNGMKQAQQFADQTGQQPDIQPPAPADRGKLLGPPAAFDKYPAQTQKESGGDPNAVSPKGALGAKQIMPATGADPGYGVKPWDGTEQDNIRFGNDYYDAMVKNYKGNVPVALAAYNWGPGNVDQWLKAGADPSKLPAETLKYVNDLSPKMQASTQPAAPPSALQEHQKLIANQVAMGLLPYSELANALDPLKNQPTYADHNGVVYETKPGEKPTPYSIPAAIKTDAQGNPITPANSGGNSTTGVGKAPSQQSSFGFKLPAMTQEEIKVQRENDKAAQLAAQNNIPIIRNAQRYIDALEPSLKDLHTGAGSSVFQTMNAITNGIIPPGIAPERMKRMADEYGNINSNTQSLALELGKLQPGQGSKGNKLALQTLINSKPGMQNTNQANMNSLSDMRAKLADIETSADIDQQYRAASPYGTTDANTRALDDALKTIYPLQSVDKNTGNVTFNQHNADLIRKLIPDAIKRPEGYLKQAQLQGGSISYDPTEAASKPTQAAQTMTTPSGISYTVVQ